MPARATLNKTNTFKQADLIPKQNLALWLRADRGIVLDTTSTPTVAQWLDQSGNGRDVTQATKTTQPTSEIIDNRVCVSFTGSHFLQYDGVLFSGAASTIFVVMKLVKPAQSQYLFDTNTSGFQSRRVALLTLSGFNLTRDGGGGGTIVNNTFTDGVTALTVCVMNGASSSVDIQDNAVTGTYSSTVLNSVSPFRLGARLNLTSFLNSNINELLVYNDVLTTNSVSTIKKYLKRKWSV